MHKFILSFVITFLSFTTPLFSQQIFNLSQYGITPGAEHNISPLVDAAIKKIRTEINDSDSIVLKFTKGTYHFYEEGATQKEYYISNHDQTQPKYIGIDLTDFQHMTLDGNGSDFIFHGQMLPICLINS